MKASKLYVPHCRGLLAKSLPMPSTVLAGRVRTLHAKPQLALAAAQKLSKSISKNHSTPGCARLSSGKRAFQSKQPSEGLSRETADPNRLACLGTKAEGKAQKLSSTKLHLQLALWAAGQAMFSKIHCSLHITVIQRAMMSPPGPMQYL